MGVLYKCSGEYCPYQPNFSNMCSPDTCDAGSMCPYYEPVPTDKPWIEPSFYESPMDVTITPPQIDPGILENTLLTITQECQITVDKDELIKALQYDRDQYNKGFEDGKRFILNRLKEVLASETIKNDLTK